MPRPVTALLRAVTVCVVRCEGREHAEPLRPHPQRDIEQAADVLDDGIDRRALLRARAHGLGRLVGDGLPRGRHRRDWDRALLKLVEPVAPERPEPATPPTAPPAPASALERALEDARWAERETSGGYDAAMARLRALLAGQQHASEPAAPAPAPVPVPPSSAAGWTVVKRVLRDGQGLVVEVREHWKPTTDTPPEPA